MNFHFFGGSLLDIYCVCLVVPCFPDFWCSLFPCIGVCHIFQILGISFHKERLSPVVRRGGVVGGCHLKGCV